MPTRASEILGRENNKNWIVIKEDTMLEVMQFIFSSFWIWLGTMLLVMALGGTLARFLNFTVTMINKVEKSSGNS